MSTAVMPELLNESLPVELRGPHQVPKNCNVISPKDPHQVDGEEPKETHHGIKPIGEDRYLIPTLLQIPSSIAYLWHRDKSDVNWTNVVALVLLQVTAIVGLIFCVPHAQIRTVIWWMALHVYTGLGITAGTHRLWSHKSYHARWPLRLFLMIGATLAYENSVFTWVRDHRLHHKASETDADPHDSRRGLFFAHMGWLMVAKNPKVHELGRKMDCEDIKKDPMLAFQHRHYLKLTVLCNIASALIPTLMWNESFIISLGVQILRLTICHHITWFINSIAHWEGDYDYNDTIWPVEAIIPAVFALGEGWHNYHHTFPNDYRTSDFKSPLLRPFVNFTWVFLDFCMFLGLASDPVVMPEKLVENFQKKHARKHK